MTIYRLGTWAPQVDGRADATEGAMLIGRVILHRRSCVWRQTLLRADNAPILTGEVSNTEDGAVLQCGPDFSRASFAGRQWRRKANS